MTALRSGLPPLPESMKGLPIDARGYPVPHFVAWLGEHGETLERGMGKPDFRCVQPGTIRDAISKRLCWICGHRLGFNRTFVIGPMCAVNRISAEPPSHLPCADFAARACPFLAEPARPRREKAMPEEAIAPAGKMIKRNPGVALVWVTRAHHLVRAGAGVLFEVGEPIVIRWYREGRAATRAEVLESIQSGLPLLQAGMPDNDPEAQGELDRAVSRAMKLIPAD